MRGIGGAVPSIALTVKITADRKNYKLVEAILPSVLHPYKGTRATVRVKSHRNMPRPYDLAIPKCKPSGAPCWCSPGYRRASPNGDLREQFASLLGRTMHELGCGQMTYQVRRLRLHGIIKRIPHSHRYRITDYGLRTALFFTRTYARILCPGLAQALPEIPCVNSSLRTCFNRLQQEINSCVNAAKLAA